MGKFFDRRLDELGAKRIYELGLGDDDGNLEEDFMRLFFHLCFYSESLPSVRIYLALVDLTTQSTGKFAYL